MTTKSVSRQADNADNSETPNPMRSLSRQADNDASSWQRHQGQVLMKSVTTAEADDSEIGEEAA